MNGKTPGGQARAFMAFGDFGKPTKKVEKRQRVIDTLRPRWREGRT